MRVLTLLRSGLLCALVASLNVACAQIPEIEDAVADSVKHAPYPEILPASQLVVLEQPRLTDSSENDLEARARRLRNRAANLQ